MDIKPRWESYEAWTEVDPSDKVSIDNAYVQLASWVSYGQQQGKVGTGLKGLTQVLLIFRCNMMTIKSIKNYLLY